jgi:tRNA(fMet)-specific endonuclease VapC
MPRPGAEERAPIVLDTSAYSHLQRGHPRVLSLLTHASHVYMPVIAIGELEAGFARGRRRAEDRAALAAFLDEDFVHVVHVDRATADRYGELVKALRQAGTPIPTNDIWIAATVTGTDGRLVTFDSDFTRVPGLHHLLLE